jgi:hypothetical protein
MAMITCITAKYGCLLYQSTGSVMHDRAGICHKGTMAPNALRSMMHVNKRMRYYMRGFQPFLFGLNAVYYFRKV